MLILKRLSLLKQTKNVAFLDRFQVQQTSKMQQIVFHKGEGHFSKMVFGLSTFMYFLIKQLYRRVHI